jgi:molybdopterin-biosynthesis enzyme MoeA-like protein
MDNDQDTTKTAGIITIGNEILSGMVQDSNSFFLVSELKKLGVNTMRISVIPDDIEIIGNETSEFSKKYDYV